MSMFDFLNDISNYEARKVAKIEPKKNNGVGVSTANSSDEGFETALLDKNGAIPVERYKTKKEAIEGHKKWVKFAKDEKNKEVVRLGGFEGLVKDEKRKLKRVIYN